MLIGVQFVRYDGAIAKAGGRVVKNVAGYDLMKLMTGAYGSLGILSELTFRLYPIQGNAHTLILTGEVAAIEQAAAAARLSGLTPVALDILSASLNHRLNGKAQPALVARFQGIAAGVAEQVERLQTISTAHSLTAQQRVRKEDEDFWQQIAGLLNPDQIICKVGMRPSAIPVLLTLLETAIPGGQALLHGSSGLGWVQLQARDDWADRLNEVRSHCQNNGGFLTLLQAPKPLRQAMEVWGYSGNALSVMREIKQKFDPGRILSPGRFVGGL